jgi:uncharacterized protein YjaG (DUF416 family)
MIEFSHDELAKKLADVSPRVRPLFAASIAERLLPQAMLFLRTQNSRLLGTAENALGLLWRLGAAGAIQENDRREAVDQCMAVIRHAEQVDTEDALLASDAVAAIAYGLRAIGSDDPSEAAWAAQRAYDTVFRFAEGQRGQRRSATDIDTDPVVQQELERQISDIATLKSLSPVESTETIDKLRQAARQQAQTIFSAGGS